MRESPDQFTEESPKPKTSNQEGLSYAEIASSLASLSPESITENEQQKTERLKIEKPENKFSRRIRGSMLKLLILGCLSTPGAVSANYKTTVVDHLPPSLGPSACQEILNSPAATNEVSLPKFEKLSKELNTLSQEMKDFLERYLAASEGMQTYNPFSSVSKEIGIEASNEFLDSLGPEDLADIKAVENFKIDPGSKEAVEEIINKFRKRIIGVKTKIAQLERTNQSEEVVRELEEQGHYLSQILALLYKQAETIEKFKNHQGR